MRPERKLMNRILAAVKKLIEDFEPCEKTLEEWQTLKELERIEDERIQIGCNCALDGQENKAH